MVQLPKEYKNNARPWILIATGCLVAAAGPFVFWFASGIHRALGVFMILGGIITAIRSYWSYTRYTIKCTPTGFSVLSENARRGARREDYFWREVTGTKYDEFRVDELILSFSVQTNRGPAFKVDGSQNGFGELITVLNEQTSHLPYIWAYDKTAEGWHVDLGKPFYNRIPRLPQATPPPLSGSLPPPPLPPLN